VCARRSPKDFAILTMDKLPVAPFGLSIFFRRNLYIIIPKNGVVLWLLPIASSPTDCFKHNWCTPCNVLFVCARLLGFSLVPSIPFHVCMRHDEHQIFVAAKMTVVILEPPLLFPRLIITSVCCLPYNILGSTSFPLTAIFCCADVGIFDHDHILSGEK